MFSSKTSRFLSVLFCYAISTNVANAIGSDAFNSKCAGLVSSLKLPNTAVKAAATVAAGTTVQIPNPAYTCFGNFTPAVDICRVSLFVTTSPTSNVSLEVWLPPNWNGRIGTTGNGGLNGCIPYSDITYLTSQGFAATGANGGHDGMSGRPFYKNLEVIKDFSWRS